MAPETLQAPATSVPLLQAGDRLTIDEFLRRYSAMPRVHKAELIEGVVYMPSPVSAEDHGEPHFRFNGFLFLYEARTPGVVGGDSSTLRLDLDNAPQPDGYLRILPECGGLSRVEDGYVEGAPELIAEIAASTASYDLHDKLHAYRRNGVREYIVWRVWDKALDWFILREGRFDRLSPGDDGIFRSETFPGLCLDAAAIILGDLPRVLDVLQTGLGSPPHQEFAQRLQHYEA
jgi:Uma2 family endonuclease